MSKQPLTCFNDDWTLEVEKLGYKDLADRVKDLLCEAPPPFSVAICGGWGSGKTSVLRYLMAATGGQRMCLDPETVFYRTAKEGTESIAEDEKWRELDEAAEPRLPSVWFNPWQHQFEQQPLRALLHEIYNQFSAWGKMKQAGSKMVNVLLNTGLRLIKDLQLGPLKIGIDAEAIQKSGEAYEKQHFLTPLDSQRFSIAFEQATAHLATAVQYPEEEIHLKDDARLVIFIDDLDRCQAARAFKLLEAIKLFLHTRHCVFVFGIDYYRLVREMACLTEFDKNERQAGDYLDKMFQALVPLPMPQESAFRGFLEGLTLMAPLNSQTDLLVSILERNPRKAKNFINSMTMQITLKGNAEIVAREAKRHVLMHYLRYYYPVVYRVLERAPESLTDLLTVCKGEAGTSNRYRFFEAKMKNELPLDPLLAKSTKDESRQVSEIALDMENMELHVDTFDCRQRFKERFATAFNTGTNLTPYL